MFYTPRAEHTSTLHIPPTGKSKGFTHISTGEGGEELELFEGVTLGGHKVEEHLQLAAPQEPPLQELAARGANPQLADLLPRIPLGLRWQRLLQRQADCLRRGDNGGTSAAVWSDGDGEDGVFKLGLSKLWPGSHMQLVRLPTPA